MSDYEISDYDTGDAPRVVDFFARCHDADPTIREVSEETWRAFVNSDFNRDAEDFRIAEADGEIVGLLTGYSNDPDASSEQSWRHFQIIVAPPHRRRGLGRALLTIVARLDPPDDDVLLRAKPPSDWTAKKAFLQTYGFECDRRTLTMEWQGDGLASPTPPEGFEFRLSETMDDNPALAEVHNAAYADAYDVAPVSSDHFVAVREFPGSRTVVAEDDGDIAGYCRVQIEDDGTGFVESLAVHPRYQRRGLGRVLLVAGMRRLDEQCPTIQLGVDERNKPALGLYRDIGFAVVDHSEHFECKRDDLRGIPTS